MVTEQQISTKFKGCFFNGIRAEGVSIAIAGGKCSSEKVAQIAALFNATPELRCLLPSDLNEKKWNVSVRTLNITEPAACNLVKYNATQTQSAPPAVIDLIIGFSGSHPP